MTDLQVIKGVECYIDENGNAQLRLENVARGLGFTQVKNGTEYVRWETVDAYLNDFGFSQQVGKDGFIPENIFYRFAMKAKNETAEKFQIMVADEILPAIRKHGMYAIGDLLENPDLLIEAATHLKEERAKRKLAEAESEKLQIELDYSKEWLSIKRVAAMNGISWKSIDWRRLKNASMRVERGVKKIFDANYGEVNTYHMSAWEIAYPNLEI